MISVRQALDDILQEAKPMAAEVVALSEAHTRVLAEPIRSEREIPPFRNSAMDGYAVQAADVAAASVQAPAVLRVVEVIAAGSVPKHEVTRGIVAKIMTGAPMPEGADAVVRVEDTESRPDGAAIFKRVVAGANVRLAGEDVRIGDQVLDRGRLLRPADIGVLASIGAARVRVYQRPRVTILATGDELVDVEQTPGPGQIVNSNAYMLAAAVAETGAVPHVFGIVRDSADAMRQAFELALRSDVVISTGGVSMGDFDFVRQYLAELGVKERFWKVAQKPGKPLSFGVRDATLAFGLPGNPVSCLVCFLLYVRPALRQRMGLLELHLPVVRARLTEKVRASVGLTDFIRCTLEGDAGNYQVRVTGSQSSGVLRSMSLGKALLIAPPDVGELAAGAEVRVLKLVEDAASMPPF